MQIVTDPEEWRRALDDARRPDGPAAPAGSVGVVPTMGALHAGHLALIRRARADTGTVAVTDYVNHLQFGPAEDLAAYPRDVERDAAMAAEAGADVLFAPPPAALWPRPGVTTVHVAGLTDRLEGAVRPGHFDGVTTIVTKLLALAGPCYAYFGEKDFQQLATVERLVEDLSLPVFICAMPTVRTPDGLALSSRNAYLTPEELAVAPRLYWSLLAGKRAIEEGGATDPGEVAAAVATALAAEGRFTLDYAAVVDPATFETPARIDGPVRILVAARLGRTRLIDNVPAGS